MRLALVSCFAVVLASPLLAQGDERATLLADWQRGKANVLRYVDAMPDSALTYHPTPGVRTFAEQIDHIVGTNDDVGAYIRGVEHAPPAGDTAIFLHHKAALHARVAASYDYVIGAIRAATAAQLSRNASLYGQPAQPGTRWLQLSMEHSVWTLGQIIPYLRLNHVTPPAYDMPF